MTESDWAHVFTIASATQLLALAKLTGRLDWSWPWVLVPVWGTFIEYAAGAVLFHAAAFTVALYRHLRQR